METDATRRWKAIRDYVFRRGALVSLDLGLPDNVLDHILQLVARSELAQWHWQILRPGAITRQQTVTVFAPNFIATNITRFMTFFNVPRYLPNYAYEPLLFFEQQRFETRLQNRRQAVGDDRRWVDSEQWETRRVLYRRKNHF